jgi:hypothetical protein
MVVLVVVVLLFCRPGSAEDLELGAGVLEGQKRPREKVAK